MRKNINTLMTAILLFMLIFELVMLVVVLCKNTDDPVITENSMIVETDISEDTIVETTETTDTTIENDTTLQSETTTSHSTQEFESTTAQTITHTTTITKETESLRQASIDANTTVNTTLTTTKNIVNTTITTSTTDLTKDIETTSYSTDETTTTQSSRTFVKTFTRGTYYCYGCAKVGGSGRNLISCGVGSGDIKGSIASSYLYKTYGYNHNGNRTKVYLEIKSYPEMTGYYYLDDSDAGNSNVIDFFYINSSECLFRNAGVVYVDCYIEG